MSIGVRPEIKATEISQGFWDACKESKLVVQKCCDCKKLRHYPQLLCPSCHSEKVEWFEIRPTGAIYSYTITRRPFHPAWKESTPYALVTVDMDDGVRMMGDILNIDPEDVKIDGRVAVEFEDMPGQGLVPRFKLVY